MDTNSQSRMFISYSHRGNGPRWKAALLKGLQVFEKHHLLDVWQDGKIRVSSFWDDDITQAMANARLAVVLLTPEALESEYILAKELPSLRNLQQQDKLPVFPVICEPCDWKAHDWLRATQAPNESNPLSQLSEPAQDRIFRQLATQIAEALSRVALAHLASPSPLGGERAGVRGEADTKTYLDKFPLTRHPGQREEKLIGREQELALLDLAFAQPHTAIVSLVAWGGVGKTMLVRQWLQRLQREGWFGARRVYAWSFYSQGTQEDRQASEDTFLAHALEWFGVQCEPTLSPWDKGRLLANAVARERTLLILDGIEPLQYPPGPMGGQLRAPGVQSLLKQLARKSSTLNPQPSTLNQTLCLVTTREPLTDLADFQRREGSPWGSVLRVDLGNLTDEAGAALLHHAGAKRAGAAEIKADDTELLAASREVDGHALTLNLLGRFLARAHGGDIRRRDLVKFEEADRKVQGGTTFKMLAAFETWFARSGEFGARQLAVLRILSLFDRPADAGCIGALRKPPVIVGLTDPLFTTRLDANTGQTTSQPLLEEDWNNASSFLADFGLVAILKDEVNQPSTFNSQPSLDCHPLISEYFANLLRRKNLDGWRSANRRVFGYLIHSTAVAPKDFNGLQPLYQAAVHGSQAGLRQEVFDEFHERILQGNEQYSWRKLGLVESDLAVMSCLFDKPWSAISSELSPEDQAFVAIQAGFYLRTKGCLTDAIELARTGLGMRIGQREWASAAIGAGNLSELELAIGETESAFADAEKAMTYADSSEEWVRMRAAAATLANVLHQRGYCEEALAYFKETESIHSKYEPQYPLLYSLEGFWYSDLLLSLPEHHLWLLMVCGICNEGQRSVALEQCIDVERRNQKMFAWRTPRDPLLDVALDNLTSGRIAVYRAVFGASRIESELPTLRNAVDGLRRSGFQDYLPAALLTSVLQRRLKGDTAGAQADLDEAWDIAERGPMRLHLADIHLHRARLFFREKHYPWKSPQDDLAAAEKLINDCGYHRRDEELADAKRAILGNT